MKTYFAGITQTGEIFWCTTVKSIPFGSKSRCIKGEDNLEYHLSLLERGLFTFETA